MGLDTLWAFCLDVGMAANSHREGAQEMADSDKAEAREAEKVRLNNLLNEPWFQKMLAEEAAAERRFERKYA